MNVVVIVVRHAIVKIHQDVDHVSVIVVVVEPVIIEVRMIYIIMAMDHMIHSE
jgi:hypothetical protein